MKTRITALILIVIAALIGYFTYAVPFKLGLDLAGGTHLVYKADLADVPDSEKNARMQTLQDLIETRVNPNGVSETIVQIEKGGVFGSNEGEQKLIVELPGVTDIEEAKKQIGKTFDLEFKIRKEMPATATASSSVQYLTTGITGRLVEKAKIDFDSNRPVVALTFNSEGRDLFAKVSTENVGNIIAIFLDGRPITEPVVQEPIRDGKAQISGNFTAKEARELAENINYGALPVHIDLISTQTIGASLGQDAVAGGVAAGVWSFIVISIFLILWYRLPGFLAVVSLGIYAVIMLALFKLFSVTLTAAGIAGFILSIGMAVDANILIFERMKEEFKRGKSLHDGIHEGFARAWLSIRDSNLSSIITGAILYFLGSSSVIRGFAAVFVLGVLVSMFTAITVSRTFLFAIVPKKGEGIKILFSNGFHFTNNK